MKRVITSNFFKAFIVLSAILFINAQVGHAKIWRVNNNAGVTADFTTAQAAVDGAAANDTLYFEASPNSYGDATLRKKLVWLGLGYFLDASGNPGLQASSPNFAYISNIYIDSFASGSQFIGLQIYNVQSVNSTVNSGQSYTGQAADNIVITRCYLSNFQLYPYGTATTSASTKADGWILNRCYFNTLGVNPTVNCSNWQVTNNIIQNNLTMNGSNNYNVLVRNNFINTSDITNIYFSNNIIYYFNSRLNSTVKNNTQVYYYNNFFTSSADIANGNNFATSTDVFVGGSNQIDTFYRPKTTSSWYNSSASDGETISGVTPKRGPFATATPYLISGIPPIPSIYQFTVPLSVPSTATSTNITISTKSNN